MAHSTVAPAFSGNENVNLLRKNLLFMLTVSGVFVGIVGGFLLRSYDIDQKTIDIIGFPGEILMNLLKMANFYDISSHF